MLRAPDTSTKFCRARLPQCAGTHVGLLKFQVLGVRKTRKGDLSVRFQLTVPCCLGSAEPTFVTFLGLTQTTPTVVNAQDVRVHGNVITAKARLVEKQTYLINSYTSNSSAPLGFTAGVGERLIALRSARSPAAPE